MKGISRIYTKALYENFRPLHANWEPSRVVKLGDFGPIDADRQFTRMGNVKSDRGLKFKEVKGSMGLFQMYFASQGKTAVKLLSKGHASSPGGPVAAKASLEVTFSGEDAVFFNAAECVSKAIEDKAALGEQIMELYQAGSDKWNPDWAVITDLIVAGATTIAISGARSASISFEAAGDVPQIDLANASIGLSYSSATNVGFQMSFQQGLNPLYGLCKIQRRFLFWDKFRPLSLSLMGPGELQETLDQESVDPFQPLSATPGADLVFAQLL